MSSQESASKAPALSSSSLPGHRNSPDHRRGEAKVKARARPPAGKRRGPEPRAEGSQRRTDTTGAKATFSASGLAGKLKTRGDGRVTWPARDTLPSWVRKGRIPARYEGKSESWQAGAAATKCSQKGRRKCSAEWEKRERGHFLK